jgi:hypothetical protein
MRFWKAIGTSAIWLVGLFSQAQYAELSCARSLALSGADIISFDPLGNPASLAGDDYNRLGIDYISSYMIPDLGSSILYSKINFSKGAFLSGLNYSGTQDCYGISYSLTYGSALTKWASGGINMKFQQLFNGSSGLKSTLLTGDIGLIFNPANHFKIAIIIKNPTHLGSDEIIDQLPVCFQLGLTYFMDQKFRLSFQFHTSKLNKVTGSFGFEYIVYKGILIRAGIKMPDIASYSFGIGYCIHRIEIDMGFRQHPWLGVSSAVGLNYKFR